MNKCPVCGAECGSFDNLLGHIKWSTESSRAALPAAHRNYYEVLQADAAHERDKVIAHEHNFQPVNTERKDIVVLYCSCGETKTTKLPEEARIVTRPVDRPVPVLPQFPRTPPPFVPRQPIQWPTRPAIWCHE